MRRTIAVAACAAILSMACGGDNDDESSSPTPVANSPTAIATVTASTASETPTVTAISAATAAPTSTAAPTATATTAAAPTTVPAGPKTVVVRLAPSSFSPASVSIAVGDTVRWNWNDGIPHSVTSRGGFESDPAGVKTEGSYSFTFTAAGTFDYYCQVHESNGMTGQVVVQ